MSQYQSPVARLRQERAWTQAELAERCGVSRAEISGIETGRLVPSVLVALRLADVLEMPVESLFGVSQRSPEPLPWAWQPADGEARLWRAMVNGKLRLFPVESTAAGIVPHDSLLTPGGLEVVDGDARPERTLVMAGCDPLVGLLTQTLAPKGIRVLPLQRSSHEALALLEQGLVHVAGVHFANRDGGCENERVVASRLGPGYSLIHEMEWQSGIATGSARPERSTRALLNARVRWVNREPGSAARETFDALLGRRAKPRGYDRVVRSHRAVAATVSSGWAEAGICMRVTAAENRLGFISLQREAYELCVSQDLMGDPRIVALAATLRSREYRRFLLHAPGCDASRAGESRRVAARVS